MRATIEKYATIGLCGGAGGAVVVAAMSGQPLVPPMLLPILIGALTGVLAGAGYGVLRTRCAR